MAKPKQKAERGTLRKVLQYIRPYWSLVLLSVIFSAVVVALTLYVPVLLGRAIDQIIAPGQVAFDAILKILLSVGVIILITALVQWVVNAINNKITYQVVRDVRDQAFSKLQRLPLKYLDAHPAGEIVSRIIADVDQFADGLLLGFTQLFTGIVTILVTLIFMLTIHPAITALVVAGKPRSKILSCKSRLKRKEICDKQSRMSKNKAWKTYRTSSPFSPASNVALLCSP